MLLDLLLDLVNLQLPLSPTRLHTGLTLLIS